MFNEIMDGVTGKLDSLFPEYRIYTDEVKQGLELPCFFVTLLDPTIKNLLGPRKFWSINLCIQCLLDSTGQISREWNRVAEVLASGMEFVVLADGRNMHGTDISVKMDSDSQTLSFFVSYNCFTYQAGAVEESMEEIRVI